MWQNKRFQRCLLFCIEPEAFWINPVPSRERAESKLAQLRAAQECGLTIPRTIISNAPDDIRAFL